MKKLVCISLIGILLLSSCSIDWYNDKKNEVNNLSSELSELNKKIIKKDEEILKLKKEINNPLDKEIPIKIPVANNILVKGKYSLQCQTKYYTNTIVGGSLIKESFIVSREGHETQILYVDNGVAKFFGADFKILQDDENFLVIIRNYEFSGLTEVVTLDKKEGIGFDVKTLGSGISGAPVSDTYLISCSKI